MRPNPAASFDSNRGWDGWSQWTPFHRQSSRGGSYIFNPFACLQESGLRKKFVAVLEKEFADLKLKVPALSAFLVAAHTRGCPKSYDFLRGIV